MATLFPSTRRSLRFGGRWAVLLLLLALGLRLLPADIVRALDRETGAAPSTARAPERTGETFPGSAYFFAENAFAPSGESRASPETNTHILPIERGPAAPSLTMRGATPLDDARALQCMTNALYYEAGNEPEEGQRAVAQVILNRLASGRWPDSLCGVIYQGGERADRGCQFTFSCDGSMARIPMAAAWSRARRVAARALSGEVFAPAGLATFYHSLAVRPPWVERVRPVAVIGAHIFYRLPGEAGAPPVYRPRYSGRESAQPGPYAFVAPPSQLPVPPGPDTISLAASLPAPAALPYARLPSAPRPASGTPIDGEAARIATLPQSTIRPEYRNSGRPLP